MIIYKDLISGAELFSDNFPMKLHDDLYYEVEGKTVSESGGGIDESLIGGNKSAEETAADEYSADNVYGCSIVLTHRLQQYPISKTDYVAVLKPYVKAVYQKLVDDKKTDRAAIFKAGMPAAIKKLKAMWVDLLPYKGDSSDENGMVCFMNYRESGDPYMIFFKDGIREEKV